MPTSSQTLTISKQFTVDGVDITFNAVSPDMEVIAAIDSGAPFPAGDLKLGNLGASVGTGCPVQLGDAARNVAFTFNASGGYDLEIISKPADVLTALSANSNLAAGLDLVTGTAPTDRFLFMKLSYALGATAKGTVALGAGLTANFGVTGTLASDWGVLHRFGVQSALAVLKGGFGAWKLPRQIKTPAALTPASWLVAEVNGSIAANVGIQAGYNFSWLKEVDGNLTGCIGVKVALAATASLGFCANGNFALALSRPDASNKLRLVVYKLAKKGWNFALNASAGVQGVLPNELQNSQDPSDLIRAIFGVQATQLIHDLTLVEKVAAGGKLSDQAADYLIALGMKKIPGAATDVDKFNAGVDAANNFICQLGTLGQRTTSQLFAMLQSRDPGAGAAVTELTSILTKMQGVAANPAQIAGIVSAEMGKVAFFQTSFGKWLTSFLQDEGVVSALAALKDNAALTAAGKAATTTLNLLNGGDMQTLVDFMASKLDLKNLGTLPHMDVWLKTKMARFLNKALGSVVEKDMTNIQNLVTKLFSQTDTFWEQAIAAAQKQYEATFLATYQSATSDTALLDVVFDFDVADLSAHLQDAIDGNFTQILIDPSIKGITLNSGVLTHGIHRQTHVELTLPMIDLGSTSATDVAGNMTVRNDGGSRVLAYDVKASNDVNSFVSGRSARDGVMTLVLNLDMPHGVYKAPDFQASFGYSLRAAYAQTGTRQLINTLTPLLAAYALPLSAADVENWAFDIDRIAEVTPTGRLGESLISLDVAVDSSLPSIWLNAPAKPKDAIYFTLSKRIQERLRSLLSNVYFSQKGAYDNALAGYPLLVYAGLPSMNSFKVNDDGSIVETGSDIYWNWPDGNLLSALMCGSTAKAAVLERMAAIQLMLAGMGNKSASSYTSDNLHTVYSQASRKSIPRANSLMYWGRSSSSKTASSRLSWTPPRSWQTLPPAPAATRRLG